MEVKGITIGFQNSLINFNFELFMKIGILTFWESTDNYGQVLQAWALQQVLKKMGHEPYLIRYSLVASSAVKHETNKLRKVLKLIAIYPIIRYVFRYIRTTKENRLRLLIEKKNSMREFAKFREKNIVVSPQIYKSIDEIRKNPPVADCYIAGSDQVWTMPLSNNNNRAYFLDFGSQTTKRISYAASFAKAVYPKEYICELKKLLMRFNSISVREKEGLEICKKIGVDAKIVLDPTLLLCRNDYLRLMSIDEETEPYVFVYSINVRNKKELFADSISQYAKENKIRIIATTSSGSLPGRELIDNAEYRYATIAEWLHYIDGAEVVFTSSFHGVAFCLIFQKNFVFIPLKGNLSKGNGRILSLFNMAHIENKVLNDEKEISKVVNAPIDWDVVKTNLAEIKSFSADYLSVI